MVLPEFDVMFGVATGFQPFPYQKWLAETGFPDIMNAPTGAGKTAGVVLSWLWRRRFAPEETRSATPRRLVYCLPMRVLVEQTYENTVRWLDRVGLLSGEAVWEIRAGRQILEIYIPSAESDLPEGWAKEGGVGGSPISVYILMGGELDKDWDRFPDEDAILIGTQDMLLSRSLNRGYAMSRFRWPVQFGLLNNDCLWVMDEVQLMDVGLPTSAQIDAFRREFGTCGPVQTVWMSATCEPGWLETVDRKSPGSDRVLYLKGTDLDAEPLRRRVEAAKDLERHGKGLVSVADPELPGYIDSLKRLVIESHEGENCSGETPLTLVIVNTVDRAQRLYRALREEIPDMDSLHRWCRYFKEKIDDPESWGRVKKDGSLSKLTQDKLEGYREELEDVQRKLRQELPDLVLVHSRFRPPEKRKLSEIIGQRPSDQGYPRGGRIIISTQVVEAGVDISANTLISELAPWSSLVQRFGRVNRYGEHESSRVIWVDVSTESGDGEKCALPYIPEELDSSRKRLEELVEVSPKRLRETDVPPPQSPRHVLRRKDLVELFDTTPDLSGNDIDVSRFIRDTRELDVQVFWREWKNNPPPDDLPEPWRDELCSVPLNSFQNFAEDAWLWDHLEGRWRHPGPRQITPGQVFLLPCRAGGYKPDVGWDPGAQDPVTPLESVTENPNEATGEDRYSTAGSWVTLREHTQNVLDELNRILGRVSTCLDDDSVSALRVAARYHDMGKAHEVFQDALLSLADEEERERRAGELWAKSGVDKRVRYSRRHFRHELASALAFLQNRCDVAGPLGEDTDLVAYLIAAHHGKVRMSIRALPDEDLPWETGGESHREAARFALGVWEGDTLPQVDLGNGYSLPETELNLEPMELGLSSEGSPSWIDRTIRLRDQDDLGIFRLGYLESLLRVADWRGSQLNVNKGGENS